MSEETSGLWLELITDVDAEAVEAVSDLFRRYSTGGVMIQEAVTTFGDREGYIVDLAKPVTVTGYLPVDAEAPERRRAIEEALWHLGQMRPVGPLRVRQIAEKDWENEWKQYFHIHRVGKHFVIVPTWRQAEYKPEPGDIELKLDPGMAFGTGLHPTTQMVMIGIEQYMQPGYRVLDLGCGSGILAIAAAKMGAASVLALDTDGVAVRVASENVAVNGAADTVTVERGTLPETRGPFDFILANIIASVLAELATHLYYACKPGAILIGSGIIDERIGMVRDAFAAAGFEPISEQQQGDWFSVTVRRPD